MKKERERNRISVKHNNNLATIFRVTKDYFKDITLNKSPKNKIISLKQLQEVRYITELVFK